MYVRLPKLALAALSVFLLHAGITDTARAAPNILLIIADDMGFDASPCYDIGAKKPSMPNLERRWADCPPPLKGLSF